MNKLVIFTLAATALAPAAAAAQAGHAGPRPNAGVTWQHRGGNQAMQRHHGNRQAFMHRRGGNHMARPGKPMVRGGNHLVRRHHGINRHHNYKRINRGFIVPHFWWGPQFHVQNWGMYGFQQPMQDRRWIRYYDDALLIDRSGRVHDGRWDMRWDDYEDRWAYNEQGVPFYGDDEEEDYGWDERDYADHDGPPPPPPPPPPMPCPQACAQSGYGYAHPGYGYGYGWMHGGMVTITETTVHAAAPQTVTKTVYIEKPARTKPRRSYKRAKPRPQPGERG